ncbi:MAG: hypothetical protein HY319_17280 [Armatimonadetes bacterium]|nr:hypothetical protein [Armatimonadota bacterium]
MRIQVAYPAAFLATKFDAYQDRGHRGYYGDLDIEDIVTVVAHRPDLLDSIRAAEPPLRTYLEEQAQVLLSLPNPTDIVSGCLPSDPVSQAVVPRVLNTLRFLAASP